MSKNLNTVQLLTITDSQYKCGDAVKYSIHFNDVTIKYFGHVISRSWIDEPGISYWEYIVHCGHILRNGVQLGYHDCDSVKECDLTKWDVSCASSFS
jgi:hypothetical protein